MVTFGWSSLPTPSPFLLVLAPTSLPCSIVVVSGRTSMVLISFSELEVVVSRVGRAIILVVVLRIVGSRERERDDGVGRRGGSRGFFQSSSLERGAGHLARGGKRGEEVKERRWGGRDGWEERRESSVELAKSQLSTRPSARLPPSSLKIVYF